GQLTDVSQCNLHDCFPCKDAVVERRVTAPAPPLPREQTRRARAAQPTSGRGPAMDTIAPATSARSTELRHRRVRLELGPAATAYACGHVQRAITAWSVPVNTA